MWRAVRMGAGRSGMAVWRFKSQIAIEVLCRQSIGGDDRTCAETAKSPIQAGADDIRSEGSSLERTNHRRGKAHLRPAYAGQLHKEIFSLQRDIVRHRIF